MPTSLAEKMQDARTLIFNSQEADIAARLETIGIDADYLSSAQTLYTEAEELWQTQQQEQQQKASAYDAFYVAKDEALETFKKTFKIVNILARKDADLRSRLRLGTAIPDAIEEWFNYTIAFYNALELETEFIGEISKFNVTTERITEERTTVETLKNLRDEARKEDGEAQEATRVRNVKLEELDETRDELRALAKLALADEPQLLEKLGIFVRS